MKLKCCVLCFFILRISEIKYCTGSTYFLFETFAGKKIVKNQSELIIVGMSNLCGLSNNL